jgi:hemoglobin
MTHQKIGDHDTDSGSVTMSIFDSIGGAPAVNVAVDKFYERVLNDPQLDHYFDGVDIYRLKAHQRVFMAAAIGGPDVYQGRDMASAHAKLAITDPDFDAVVGHLVATLTELEVPHEIIADIGSALAPLRSDIVSVPTSPTRSKPSGAHHVGEIGNCPTAVMDSLAG